MIIGAHIDCPERLNAANDRVIDLLSAVDRAEEIGAEAIQLFVSSPRSYRFGVHRYAEVREFRKRIAAAGLAPPFIHAIYLVNLASRNPYIVRRSVESLGQHLATAARIGAAGVVFHPGHHNGRGYDAVFPQMVEALKTVMEQAPAGPILCLETMTGMRQRVGNTFAELGQILSAVDHPRLGVCLDTQHSFAAGYDLSTADGIAQTMQEFDAEIGLERLVVVHANDSARRLGSRGHGHANIGDGLIGEPGFTAMMAHPAFAKAPFILEVPGDGQGPDAANVALLKAIRQGIQHTDDEPYSLVHMTADGHYQCFPLTYGRGRITWEPNRVSDGDQYW